MVDHKTLAADTNSSAGHGRIVDYFVASTQLTSIIEVDRDLESPWKAHPCLVAIAQSRLRQILIQAQKKVKPNLAAMRNATLSWHEAKEVAGATVVGEVPGIWQQHLDMHPQKVGVQAIDKDWQTGRKQLRLAV
jgi:hypothetical protein